MIKIQAHKNIDIYKTSKIVYERIIFLIKTRTYRPQGCSNHTEGNHPELTDNTNDKPWEAQVGWIYMGHGEWTQQEIVQGEHIEASRSHGRKLKTAPEWV